MRGTVVKYGLFPAVVPKNVHLVLDYIATNLLDLVLVEMHQNVHKSMEMN